MDSKIFFFWWGGGGGAVARCSAPSRGGLGPPDFFFNFRPSESASGAFSDHLGMDHITNVITTWQDLTPKN